MYDLATGKLYKVRKDDPRYLEEDTAAMEGREPRFVHRKPSKKAKQEYAARELIGGSPVGGLFSSPAAQTVAATAATAAAPRVIRSVPKLIKAASKVSIPLGRLAGPLGAAEWVPGLGGIGVIAAAGLTSYFTTRYIMERFSKGGRLDAALAAYLKSRRELAAHLGRPLKPEEIKALFAHYKQVTEEIKTGKGWD